MKKILLLLAVLTAMCVQADDYLYIEDADFEEITKGEFDYDNI